MDVFFLIVEYAGIIAFAVSAAMIAIDKEADIVGVIILALVTCFGGGILRDIMLGNFPPKFFTEYYFEILTVLISAVLVFIFAAKYKKTYIKNEERINSITNIFDAAGLGSFAVYSTNLSIEAGHTRPLVAISMGIVAGVCGGLVRDLMLGSIPFVLRKRVYLVACAAGAAAFYVIFMYTEAGAVISMLAGMAITFILRILATVFKWNMPRAINFSKLRGDTEEK